MPDHHSPDDAASLRLTLSASQRLVHELRVLQVKVKAQSKELRQNQQALEASHAQWVDLYELAPVGYCSVNEAGTITRANLTLATLLGVVRNNLNQQPLSRFIHRQHQDLYYRLRQSQLGARQAVSPKPARPPEPTTCELRMVRGDGTAFWAFLSSAQGPDSGWLVTLTDITQRKLSETQLHKLSRITEQSPMAIVISDLRGAIEYVNPRFTEVTGYSFAEVLGKNPHLLQSGHTPLGTYMDMWQTLVNGQIWRGELFNRKKNGELFVEKAVIAAVFGPDGKPTHYVSLKEDITQIKSQEQVRLDLTKRVKALSRALLQAQEQTRKRFSRELHDRTSPNLAALRINLDMIVSASPQTYGTPAFVDRVLDTRALIEDTTLSIREICAELHPPTLDRGGLLGTVQSYALQLARRTGLQVPVHCSHGEIHLDADLELALFRILQEALTNCVKHAQATQVRVVVQLDTNPMQISVTDDGVGFDPSPAQAGALRPGLGLVNMQETAEFAGVTYALFTAPGQGTRIMVEIAQPAQLPIPTPHP